jgi:hypothetical protein
VNSRVTTAGDSEMKDGYCGRRLVVGEGDLLRRGDSTEGQVVRRLTGVATAVVVRVLCLFGTALGDVSTGSDLVLVALF